MLRSYRGRKGGGVWPDKSMEGDRIFSRQWNLISSLRVLQFLFLLMFVLTNLLLYPILFHCLLSAVEGDEDIL
jgi:hypothetical protein